MYQSATIPLRAQNTWKLQTYIADAICDVSDEINKELEHDVTSICVTKVFYEVTTLLQPNFIGNEARGNHNTVFQNITKYDERMDKPDRISIADADICCALPEKDHLSILSYGHLNSSKISPTGQCSSFWVPRQKKTFFLFGNGKMANTQKMKQIQKPKNKKIVHRSQQQRMIQAFKAEDMVPDDGMATRIDEGKYDDLTDGVRKDRKRENMERQDDHCKDQSEIHGGKRERTDRGKDKNPEGTPASREQRKGPDGRKNAEGSQHE